jgi:hypothetical protein
MHLLIWREGPRCRSIHVMPHETSSATSLTSLRTAASESGIDGASRLGGNDYVSHMEQALGSRLPIVWREWISASKLGSATEFARMLTRLVPFISTIAVTGSVAYRSARKWDDIDLFIVTKQNRLWVSAFLTLVSIRLSKLLHLRPSYLSQFCLSYVHDELGFVNESQRSRLNMLFARELLKAQPIAGIDRYRIFLEQNGWIRSVYSNAYSIKLKQLEQRAGARKAAHSSYSPFLSFLMDWTEGFAFAFLSRYLRLRAYLTKP